MNIDKVKILTARKWNDYFPFQVVYEWEDILAKHLNIEMDCDSMIGINKIWYNKINSGIQKVIRNSFLGSYLDSSFNYLKRRYPDNMFIAFILYPLPINNFYLYSENVIPVLLDCFGDVIDKIPGYFCNSKILFVTNLEVWNHLQNTSLAKKAVYVPLSISDRHLSSQIPDKDIDVIQMGRKNSVLHEWMLQLIGKYPQIEYVYSDLEGKTVGYRSSIRGWLGPVDTRADFMSLLGSAKISLLSSPGVDGGEVRTGGFNPVTPRFFESAASYCYMVGRYPVNGADFKYCNIKDVCKHYEDYVSFESDLLRMIQTPFNQKDSYDLFIKQHLTSRRAHDIREAILTL